MSVNLTRRHLGSLMMATAAAVPAAAVLVPRLAAAAAPGYANPHLLISAEALATLRGPLGLGAESAVGAYETHGIALVDVRPAEDYEAGHIPGARHLDPNAVVDPHAPVEGALRSQAEVAAILGGLGLNAAHRVVFYDDRGGFHAARMFWLLEYLGHRDIALLNGGLSAWVAAGGPLSSTSPAFEARPFGVSAMPRRVAHADYLLRHQHDPETVVVDVRPTALFEEGHIPWAINLPWALNLTEDKMFRPADALAAPFEAAGVTPDRNVVIHCQQGLASSHSYVALRLLGYPRVRVYHRSWAEWGTADDLPKATGA